MSHGDSSEEDKHMKSFIDHLNEDKPFRKVLRIKYKRGTLDLVFQYDGKHFGVQSYFDYKQGQAAFYDRYDMKEFKDITAFKKYIKGYERKATTQDVT